MRKWWCLAAVVVMTGCKREVQLEPYRAEFVYTTLAYRPTQATAMGFHRWGGDILDEKLDDWGEGNLDQLRRFYEKHRKAMEGIPQELLSAEDREDYRLIMDRMTLAEFELNKIRSYKYDPRVYVNGITDGLMGLYAGEHGPKKLRYFDIVRRLEWVRKYVAIAEKNLVASPESWNVEARARNKELIRFLNEELKADCAPELQPKFGEQAPKAAADLEEFGRWMEGALTTTQKEWRMEPPLYAAKLKLELGVTVEEASRAAEEDMARWKTVKAEYAGEGGAPPGLKLLPAPGVLMVEGARLLPGAVLHPEEKSRVWVQKGAENRLAMARVALREAAWSEARKIEPRSRKVLRTVFAPAWYWERWPEKGAERHLLREAAKLWAQIEMVSRVSTNEETIPKLMERAGVTREEAGDLVREVELLGAEIPAGYWGWRMEQKARGGKR